LFLLNSLILRTKPVAAARMKAGVSLRAVLVLATAWLLGYFARRSRAFQPVACGGIIRCHGRFTSRQEFANLVLRATADNDNNENANADDDKKKAIGRAGGRSRQMSSRPKQEEKRSIVAYLVLFSLMFVLSPLFDGVIDSSSPSVYYYQSSSFEMTVYSQDGSVQTSRKESVQTNIPTLLEGRRLLEDKQFMEKGYTRPSIEHDDF